MYMYLEAGTLVRTVIFSWPSAPGFWGEGVMVEEGEGEVSVGSGEVVVGVVGRTFECEEEPGVAVVEDVILMLLSGSGLPSLDARVLEWFPHIVRMYEIRL